MHALIGHTSPATAYVVDDYPYGFRLRCQIRYWIEHKDGHGFRIVSQTTNPKRPGTVWNRPKAGTYTPVMVLVLTDEGRVEPRSLSAWADEGTIDAYEAAHTAALTAEHREAIRYLRALSRAQEHVTFHIATGDGPRQTREEVEAIWQTAVDHELRQTDAESRAVQSDPDSLLSRRRAA